MKSNWEHLSATSTTLTRFYIIWRNDSSNVVTSNESSAAAAPILVEIGESSVFELKADAVYQFPKSSNSTQDDIVFLKLI
jgi:hypothetical protein